MLKETLTPNGRPLELVCTTGRTYGGGYTIENSVRYQEGLVKIEFTGIREPVSGGYNLAPAVARIRLDSARAHYGLHFKVNGEVVPAQLHVNVDSFVVNHGEGRWIKFPVTVFHRVPPGTIWGYMYWGPSDESAHVQAALDALAGIGAKPKVLAPGDYGYFQIDRNGTMVGQPVAYFSKTFLYGYTGDEQALADVVSTYAGPIGFDLANDLGHWWFGYQWPQQPAHQRPTRAPAGPS